MDKTKEKMIDDLMHAWSTLMKDEDRFPVLLISASEDGKALISGVGGLTPAGAKTVMQDLIRTMDTETVKLYRNKDGKNERLV